MKNKNNPIAENLYSRAHDIELMTRPDVGVDQLFEVQEGYEGITKLSNSPLYQTADGEAVAFRMGPKINDDPTVEGTSNSGEWKNGPPSSFGEGIALFSDPRLCQPNMFPEKVLEGKTLHVVALGKKAEDLEYGSKKDQALGLRTLGAVAANASVLSPAEAPFIQGRAVELMQKRSKDSILVFSEKLWPNLLPGKNAPGVDGRWLLAKGEAIKELKVVGKLKE